MALATPTLFPLWRDDFPMAVHDAPARDAAILEQMRSRWSEMRQANPRLFDGPLLTLRHLDRTSGALSLQRDSYMPYAVQPHVDTGTISLGVTAILVHGTGTTAAYLFGQRASRTHMYPNQWELGPSGALAPPAAGVLTLKDLYRQLESEITEEIGVGLTLSEVNTAPVCLILDGEARSLDLVMSVTMAARPKIIANWEYPATAWVTAEEFPQWSRKREVIGPTRTIMEWLSHRKPQGATN